MAWLHCICTAAWAGERFDLERGGEAAVSKLYHLAQETVGSSLTKDLVRATAATCLPWTGLAWLRWRAALGCWAGLGRLLDSLAVPMPCCRCGAW